jgi:hypothetical protein
LTGHEPNPEGERRAMPETSTDLYLKNRRNAYISWANTPDRSARTANARKAFENKFLAEADGDKKRAEALRKAFYANLVLKSVQSRKRQREIREDARRQRIAALIADGGDS